MYFTNEGKGAVELGVPCEGASGNEGGGGEGRVGAHNGLYKARQRNCRRRMGKKRTWNAEEAFDEAKRTWNAENGEDGDVADDDEDARWRGGGHCGQHRGRPS